MVPGTGHHGPKTITQADAMAITGASRRTVQRWIRRGRIPPVYLKLLQRDALGTLPAPFENWRIVDGHLVSDAGDSLAPGDLSWITLNVRLVSELRKRLEMHQERRSGLLKRLRAS